MLRAPMEWDPGASRGGCHGDRDQGVCRASEHLPIAKVTNIARTLVELKEKNLWIVGLDERVRRVTTRSITTWIAPSCWAQRARVSTTGGEEVRLPGLDPHVGKVPSLNVSVAAGVMLYEIVAPAQDKS